MIRKKAVTYIYLLWLLAEAKSEVRMWIKIIFHLQDLFHIFLIIVSFVTSGKNKNVDFSQRS